MLNSKMKACIDACLECYRTCTEMASRHCLEQGGAHVEPSHLRTMLACAETCRTSAHVMMLATPLHRHTCAACAEICAACAGSCRGLDGMEDCVATCERCAAACREMAGA